MRTKSAKKNSQENLDEKDEIFVKQLMDIKNEFSDEEIVDEVVIFLIAVSFKYYEKTFKMNNFIIFLIRSTKHLLLHFLQFS